MATISIKSATDALPTATDDRFAIPKKVTVEIDEDLMLRVLIAARVSGETTSGYLGEAIDCAVTETQEHYSQEWKVLEGLLQAYDTVCVPTVETIPLRKAT